MPKEQQPQPPATSLRDVFGFSNHEMLDYRLSHKRLMELIDDDRSVVHSVSLDYNNYGEWLFVTLSLPAGDKRHVVTFYGLGFHEYRERWYTDQWFWYRAHNFPDTMKQRVSKAETRRRIDESHERVSGSAKDAPEPSSHAALFALIADLTDEDGALAELDDLGEDIIDRLAGDSEE